MKKLLVRIIFVCSLLSLILGLINFFSNANWTKGTYEIVIGLILSYVAYRVDGGRLNPEVIEHFGLPKNPDSQKNANLFLWLEQRYGNDYYKINDFFKKILGSKLMMVPADLADLLDAFSTAPSAENYKNLKVWMIQNPTLDSLYKETNKIKDKK